MSGELDRHEWADIFDVLSIGIVVIEDELSGWEDLDPDEIEDDSDRVTIREWKSQILSARKAQQWIIENKINT